jgi:hypothetical protein
MRVLLAVCLFNPIAALAAIRALPPLTKAGLVGTWEAIVVRDGLPGGGVYMMRFDVESDGYFVHVVPFREYGGSRISLGGFQPATSRLVKYISVSLASRTKLTASRCFTQFYMISTNQLAATSALARGSSSCSR